MKRLAFAALTLAVALALLEGGARVALRALPAPSSHRDVQTERPKRFGGSTVLHPYLGFVEDPATLKPSDLAALGFYSGPLVRERKPDTYVVGVFGGSVASIFADEHRPEVAFADLAAGRRIVVLNVALGGYKQPQSLLSLAYLLTLGVEFDLVLLIDGLNDVVLSPVENTRRGVSPIYPRSWGLLVADLETNRGVRDVLAQLGLLADVRRWLEPWEESRIGVVALAGRAGARAAAARDQTLRERLRVERVAAANGYQATGPVLPDGPGFLVDVWREGSLAMRSLAEGSGARFVHVLQPNQYSGAPKPMGEAERSLAYLPEQHPYAEPARRGYPLLREAGRELVAAGVEFHDLADVFAAVPEAIYIDPCCHFDGRGNELLAEALRERLRD